MQAVPALLASLHGLSVHDDARAREEQAEREYQRSQARQRPAAGPAPAASSAAPRVFTYKVHTCIAATSAEIATWIAQSEAETRRLQGELANMIARTGRLRLDLATKRLQEASS
jgi:hypothetical protein